MLRHLDISANANFSGLEATVRHFILLVITANAAVTLAMIVLAGDWEQHFSRPAFLVIFAICHLPLGLKVIRASLPKVVVSFAVVMTLSAWATIVMASGAILTGGVAIVMTATFISLLYRRKSAMLYTAFATALALVASNIANPLSSLLGTELGMRVFACSIIVGSAWVATTLARSLIKQIAALLKKTHSQARQQHTLLQTLNHEMRAPVAALNLLANDTRIETHQGAIRALSRHVLTMLSDFKSANNPEASRSIRVLPFDPRKLLSSVTSELEPALNARNIKLTIDNRVAAGELLQSDPHRLQTILSDLIRSIVGLGECHHIDLMLRYDFVRQKLCLRVQSDQTCMQEAQLQSLFNTDVPDPFEVDETRLNLYLIKVWTEKLRGKLAYVGESDITGPSIKIEIPAAAMSKEPPTSTAKDPVAAAKPLLAGKRVLIVDDNGVVRSIHAQLLAKHFRARVHVASDGAEALKMMPQEQYDLIIMSYLLPQIHGDEVIELMRITGIDTPVIAVTAATIGDEIQRLYSAGADLVLRKPLNLSELAHCLVLLFGKAKTSLNPAELATDDAPTLSNISQ